MTPHEQAAAIAGSVGAALVQISELHAMPARDVEDLARAIGNNAAQALVVEHDPLAVLVAAVRALGVHTARVSIMPAGHVAIDLQVHTDAEVVEAAARFGMGAPELATNGRNEWWHAERGEYGAERISVVGGHRPVCQCHGAKP